MQIRYFRTIWRGWSPAQRTQRNRGNRATCSPDPRKPTLSPTTDLHDDITRCHGRICKRILAIHIYRMANATGRRSRRSVRLFRALSLSPPVTVALLTLSVLAPSLPLSFHVAVVHSTLSLSLSLSLSGHRRSLPVCKVRWPGRDRGSRASRGMETESFVHGRTSVTRKNICVIIY